MVDWQASCRNGKERAPHFNGNGKESPEKETKAERAKADAERLKGYGRDLRDLRDASNLIDVNAAEERFWNKIRDLYGKDAEKAKVRIEDFAKGDSE